MLVVYEPRIAGEGVLEHAAQLARRDGARLTVVTSAPQDTDPARCVVGTPAFNAEVRRDAAAELALARERLAEVAGVSRFKLLVTGRDPILCDWAARECFDMILIGARAGLAGRRTRRLAAALRHATGAEVRVVRG